MVEACGDPEIILAQFNRLIQDLIKGSVKRNCFQRWEIALLLDIQACNVRESSRRDLLRRYQRAVERHMEKGAPAPLTLSEYLEANRRRRASEPAAALKTA